MSQFYKEVFALAHAAKEGKKTNARQRVAAKQFADKLESAIRTVANKGDFEFLLMASHRVTTDTATIDVQPSGEFNRTDGLPVIEVPVDLFDEIIAKLQTLRFWLTEHAVGSRNVAFAKETPAPANP